MTIDEIRALYDEEQRRNVVIPGMRREEVPSIVRYVDLTGHDSELLYSHLPPEAVETTIHEQTAYFSGLGHDFEWKVYDYDPPPDLRDRLVAHGFVADDAEAIMVLDVADLPVVLTQPTPADIRLIADPAGLHDVIAVEAAVWAEDRGWLARLGQEMELTPDDLRIYVAYVDGAPAAAAWIRFHPDSQFAGLWGGSTVAAYRK